MAGSARGRWARVFPKTFLEVGIVAMISSSRKERELIRTISIRLNAYCNKEGFGEDHER